MEKGVFPHWEGAFLFLLYVVQHNLAPLLLTIIDKSVYLHRGFFIIVLDLRLTKLIRACRETGFNCL